jgi:hypothetical protein
MKSLIGILVFSTILLSACAPAAPLPNQPTAVSIATEKVVVPSTSLATQMSFRASTAPPVNTVAAQAIATFENTATAEVMQGKWEKFGNTDYMVYRDSNGKVEMAKVVDTKYAAELIEVQSLPPILVLTSQEFLKNVFDNRKVALNPTVTGANNNIEEAYMGALAVAKLRAGGNGDPTLAQMQTAVAGIEKQIKDTGKVGGITFADYRGDKSNLTGQPLIIKLEPYTTNNPNWPMTTMYTYNFVIDSNSLIMNLFIQPYTMDQLKNQVYADDMIANDDLMQNYNVQKSILLVMNMVFQALDGDKPSVLLSRPEAEQFTRGDYQLIRNSLDPDYINYRNIWLGGEFLQKIKAADKAHDTATMKQMDASPDYPLRSYVGTSSLDAVSFDITLLDK